VLRVSAGAVEAAGGAMTWLDRAIAAQQPGGQLSSHGWVSPCTCPVGETLQRVLGRYDSVLWMDLHNRTNGSDRAYRAIIKNDGRALEDLLYELEDAALQLKREQQP